MGEIVDTMQEDGFEEIKKSKEYMDVWKFIEDHLFTHHH